MNNFRWNVPFMGNRRGIFQRNEPRGRMGMFLTLVALGAGAVWYGISEKRNQNRPIRKQLQKFQRSFKQGDTASETAFAEELLGQVVNNNEKKS